MRLGNGLGIRAVRTCLPVTVETAQDALTRGRISNEDLTNTGVREVPVSGTVSAPDMAVEAARGALAAAGWDGHAASGSPRTPGSTTRATTSGRPRTTSRTGSARCAASRWASR